MRADEVYAILKGKLVKLTEDIKTMGDWKPIQHKGTVQTADDLPTDAKEGWMYNIATDSIYGAAGMNVVMTADGWDPMGPIINMAPYLTKKEAGELYQPKGNYPTKEEVKEGYQPKGNYLTNIPQAAGDVLGGIKAEPKTEKEVVPAKIDPETGKIYVPELPGSEDLSKENTTQQILAKLQEVIPLINQIAQSGTAGSVNGFSFVHGDDGSVMITYTPDGSTEAEVAVLPKETTQKKISKATKEIADSLKIIAGKEDKA